MIGVIPADASLRAIEEFFQLFKTPWELFAPGRSYDVVLVAGGGLPKLDARLVLHFASEFQDGDRRHATGASRTPGGKVKFASGEVPIYGDLLSFEDSTAVALGLTGDARPAVVELNYGAGKVLRIGYDLFREISCLLSDGQPVHNAHYPTIELHANLLRTWILDAGLSLLEIPPIPAGLDFIVCLTHDIDFVGIRRHKLDHSVLGFLYRSTVGGLRDFMRGKIGLGRLAKMWGAAAKLPLVHLGLAEDFWMPFEWYLQVERGLSPTYFFIPFKGRAGSQVPVKHAGRRASAYDVADVADWLPKLVSEGCEVGVHGIDAWHSVEAGREELRRSSSIAGHCTNGVRMHWLLSNSSTPEVLEQAGYAYDSTAGYNETVGYRCGTTQVFRPVRAQRILEIPLHIQDGALFFPQRLGLSESAAWAHCGAMIDNARNYGGVLTVLWHDRSHGPERFWGEFYRRLVEELKSQKTWFATASQAVDWFERRRQVVFEPGVAGQSLRLKPIAGGLRPVPPMRVRIHRPAAQAGETQTSDLAWDGKTEIGWDPELGFNHPKPAANPAGNARATCPQEAVHHFTSI